MRLRVLLADGDVWRDVVTTTDDGHTVRDLTRALADHLGVGPPRHLLVGVPPRSGPDPATPVVDSGLRWGDRLTLAADFEEAAVPDVPLRRLVTMSGPDAGRGLDLAQGRFVVGRSDRADLTVVDRHMSREHLQVDVTPQGIAVADLDSSNGTTVDGRRIGREPVRITHRTALVAGATVLSVRPPRPRAPSPAVTDGLVGFRPRPAVAPADATIVYRTRPTGRLRATLARRLPSGGRPDEPDVDVVGRRAAHPGARTLLDRSAQLEPPLWERTDADHLLDLRVGWAWAEDGIDPVVLSSLREQHVVVVCRDAALRLGVLRWAVVQLAALCSPTEVGIVLAPRRHPELWEWATWLPHATFDGAAGPAHVVTVTDDIRSAVPPVGSMTAPRAGSTPQLHILAGAAGHDEVPPGAVTITVDSTDGTLVANGRSGRRRADGVDAVGADVALELALTLAPIRPIAAVPDDLLHPEPVRLLDLLGGGPPDPGWIRRRWTERGSRAAPIGRASDGPIEIELGTDCNHVRLVARDLPARDLTLTTLVASLAATWSTNGLRVVLIMEDGTRAEIAAFPHVTVVPPGDASSWLGRELTRRSEVSEAEGMPRLLVVSTDGAVPDLDEHLRAILSGHHDRVHAVLASIEEVTTSDHVSDRGNVLTLHVDSVGRDPRTVRGVAEFGSTAMRFVVASLAAPMTTPNNPGTVIVHDVVGGRIVEDSRTATQPFATTPDRTSDLDRLMAACRVAADGRAGRDAASVRAVVRTFMFTDVVRSTALVEAIGDDHWTRLLQWHDEALVTVVERHDGEVVDHTGDGFFVVFEDVGAAVRCAIDIQHMLRRHRSEAGFAPEVRIGLHTAEARHDGRYRGRGVHVAARIAALAGGGEVLASAASLEGIAGVRMHARRTEELRGLSTPVPLAQIGID